MFSPFKVNGEFLKRIVSLCISSANMSAGTLVDLDSTDTSAITGSVGFSTLRLGTVKPATITTTSVFPREFGMAIPDVSGTGIAFEDRVLGMAQSYMTIPVGMPVAVFKPSAGDIIATDQYVGALAGDTGATGLLDITLTANYGKPLAVFQGRFRIAQAGDVTRARFIGTTTVGTATAALVEFA